MGKRIVEFYPGDLLDHCRSGMTIRCLAGIPSDAKILNYGYWPDRDCFFYLLESAEWEEALEGQRIPCFDPQWERLG